MMNRLLNNRRAVRCGYIIYSTRCVLIRRTHICATNNYYHVQTIRGEYDSVIQEKSHTFCCRGKTLNLDREKYVLSIQNRHLGNTIGCNGFTRFTS